MRQGLFGTSGIRGIVNTDYYAYLPLTVGLAIATMTNSGNVIIGRDTRVSSSMIEESLISGLLAGGSIVHCLGLVPTPVLAFLTRELDADTGVMITASHNPPEYNGVKLFGKDSCAYDDDQQVLIEEIIKDQSFRRICASAWKTPNDARKIDAVSCYSEAIQNKIKLNKKWRIVLDLGNGATCSVAPRLFREKNCDVITINSHPDGFFSGRKPVLDAESLLPLSNVVKNLSVDIGIAYDADGDRMAVIDEKGLLIPLDQLMAAFAAHLVKKRDGGVVVTTVEASLCIESMVEQYFGKVIRTKVGDVAIATATKKYGAIFGGEPCGAWINPQYHLCPDGILSSLLLLEFLEESCTSLSSLISKIPHYSIIRKDLVCYNRAKKRVMEDLTKKLPLFFEEGSKVTTLDGIRIDLEKSWVLIRSSGTEPLIRLTVEAESERKSKSIMENVIELTEAIIKRRLTLEQ